MQYGSLCDVAIQKTWIAFLSCCSGALALSAGLLFLLLGSLWPFDLVRVAKDRNGVWFGRFHAEMVLKPESMEVAQEQLHHPAAGDAVNMRGRDHALT